MPDRRADQAPIAKPVTQIIAPGDDMCAGHVPEFFRPLDACKEHEVLDGVFVGAFCAGVANVLEPFNLGRNLT